MQNDGQAPDTNKTLTIGHSSRQTMTMEFKQFLGPDWGIFSNTTNTCILDSWLVLFYAPYHAQQILILRPYPELSDESSLLNSSFSLLDNNGSDEAWILWIDAEFSDRINSADIYDDTDCLVAIDQRVKSGNTTSHPMVKTMLIHFSKRRFCQWPGGCRSIAHVFGEVESQGEEMSEDMHMRNETNTLCMNIFYNNSIKESLDTIMGATMKPSCKIHWYSEDAQKSIPCEGPSYYEEAHQIHWTHTITFIFGGQTVPMSKLESKCVYDDK